MIQTTELTAGDWTVVYRNKEGERAEVTVQEQSAMGAVKLAQKRVNNAIREVIHVKEWS